MGITKNIDGKTVEVSGRVFTFSNWISFSRFLVAFPVVILHYQNNQSYNWVIISLIAYAAVSDYLDGLVARKTNTISEVGKVIDPVSDKLCAVILFIYTVWLGWVPLWFLLINVVRDSLIMVGSSLIKIRYGKVAMSTMTGKIYVNILAFYWIAVFFFRDEVLVHEYLLYISTAMMVISFFAYLHRYREIMKGATFN
ncbi:MAG: CDP-alcohol phosphatidyltransferase family protein [Balneolaceae bacterium]